MTNRNLSRVEGHCQVERPLKHEGLKGHGVFKNSKTFGVAGCQVTLVESMKEQVWPKGSLLYKTDCGLKAVAAVGDFKTYRLDGL